MDNKDIIELYKKGASIKHISHKYYVFKNSVYSREQAYHVLGGYNVNKYGYYYKDAVIHVQKTIINYLSGYYD